MSSLNLFRWAESGFTRQIVSRPGRNLTPDARYFAGGVETIAIHLPSGLTARRVIALTPDDPRSPSSDQRSSLSSHMKSFDFAPMIMTPLGVHARSSLTSTVSVSVIILLVS